MNGKRCSKFRETGSFMTAATKLTSRESEELDALAAEWGVSRYEMIRVVIRSTLRKYRQFQSKEEA